MFPFVHEYVNGNPIGWRDPSGEQGIIVMLQDPVVIDPALMEEGLQASGGKNSMPLPDGGRLDMLGRAHTNPDGTSVPTPHVHDPLPPFEGDNWWRYPGADPEWARPATPEDFVNAIKHNKPDPLPSELWPTFRPGVPLNVAGRKPKTPSPVCHLRNCI